METLHIIGIGITGILLAILIELFAVILLSQKLISIMRERLKVSIDASTSFHNHIHAVINYLHDINCIADWWRDNEARRLGVDRCHTKSVTSPSEEEKHHHEH